MINHIWSVLCQRNIVDQVSNNVSMIDVFESVKINAQINPGNTLIIPFPFCLVTLWGRRKPDVPCQGLARLIALNPKGKTITEKQQDIDLAEYVRARHTLNFLGFPIQSSGQYKFRIQIQDDKKGTWKNVAEVPLEVTISSDQ